MTESSTRTWTGSDLTDTEFDAITQLLRDRRKFDLGHYKDRCIRRRIAKRLRVCEVTSFSAYLNRLEIDPDELDTLMATISIHVSHFFRNPDTFRILEQKVLPDLCHRARQRRQKKLTLWSAGCSSGEEAYSLALLVDDMAVSDLDVRVLATDISEPILEFARCGNYQMSHLKEVPKEVLSHYFEPQQEGHYRIIERIRDKVVFLRHNVMTASEYPAADLILCRNVLIYFTRPEQDRILSRFANALPEHGALILGRAETLTGSVRGFYRSEFPVERVYRRTAAPVAATFI